jgi:hypothetical protein
VGRFTENQTVHTKKANLTLVPTNESGLVDPVISMVSMTDNSTKRIVRIKGEKIAIDIAGEFALENATLTRNSKLVCVSKEDKWKAGGCLTVVVPLENGKNEVQCQCDVASPTTVVTQITDLLESNNLEQAFSK